MKIILKPKSHPELGEIVIEESFFAIGRFEHPFVSHQNSAAARLSRRHARIFQEEGAAYLVDLGDLNATSLNGRIVQKKPVRLHDGDEIGFANQLFFTVQIRETSAAPASSDSPPLIRLILTPAQDNIGLEPIIINRFPFLISKDSEVFSRYKKNFSEAIKYISRRQALFFVRDGHLYIEDLCSKNGTFVSGMRLQEDAVLLKDGDLIALGGDRFAYSVSIERAERKESIPEPGTILVATADSFLNIFCQQDDDEANGDRVAARKTDESTNRPGKADARIPARPRLTVLNKIRVFLAELKAALAEEKPAGSKRVWLIGGVGVLLIALLFGVYIRGGPERELKGLMAKGQYAESVGLANRYLEEYPDDENVNALATDALLKYLMPSWMESLENRQFADAEGLLAQTRNLSVSHDEGLKMLELIEWIGNLQKFLSERGGLDAPIIIFKHEDQMDALIDWWDSDDSGHRHLMVIILRYVPSFENMYSQVFSQLRTLNNEKSVYLSAIAELKQTIREKLDANRVEDLPAIIKSFENKYPKIEGMDRVWTDLETWMAVQETVQARNLAEAVRLSSSAEFSTPPFRDKTKDWMHNILPPADVIDQYQKAEQAWSSGDFNLALTILEPLTQAAWGEIAVRKLGRYKKIVRDFPALKAAQGGADYRERLLAFYSALDPAEDAFFLNALEADYQGEKEKALKNAEALLQSAGQDWSAYQANGGIGGLLRLEDKISVSFRQQAGLLAQAHDSVIRGVRIYDLLQLEYPADVKSLHGEILAEARRQRQWLSDMRMVLNRSLLEAKLQLLPASEEGNP